MESWMRQHGMAFGRICARLSVPLALFQLLVTASTRSALEVNTSSWRDRRCVSLECQFAVILKRIFSAGCYLYSSSRNLSKIRAKLLRPWLLACWCDCGRTVTSPNVQATRTSMSEHLPGAEVGLKVKVHSFAQATH